MKIAIAQIKPLKGQVDKNIASHLKMIDIAIKKNVDAIFFPELSITSYEPEWATKLKMEAGDARLKIIEEKSNKHNITIGVGVPTISYQDVKISMVIFQPHALPTVYSKQTLHDDEKPFFIEGDKHIIINVNGTKIAPAICYESLQKEHLLQSIKRDADLYLASVAKSQTGIDKASSYFSQKSKDHSIPILMVNAIGYCDNFMSAGQSSIWNRNGELIGQLGSTQEGLLIYNSANNHLSSTILTS